MTQYFEKQQDSAPRPRTLWVRLLGHDLTLVSVSGVFSKRRIDRGTELLIKSAEVKEGWRVLDLGCGYGAVGVALAKARSISIVLADVNERAVLAARKNMEMNSIHGKAVVSDGFAGVRGTFDTVLLNPPQRAGKGVCFRLISESREHLRKHGLLQVVARHNKGGKHLSENMAEVFGNCEAVAKQGGFRVYMSRR